MPIRRFGTAPLRTALGAGAALLLSLVIAHTPATQALEPLQYDIGVLEDGDFLFRRGRSLRSLAVLRTGGSGLSHVGIIVHIDERPFVAHAPPGESGSRLEPIEAFLAPDVAADAALFRRASLPADARAEIAAAARALALEGRPFDNALDLSDTSALYCTELALLALRAVEPEATFELRTLRLFGIERQVLTPHDLAAGLQRVAFLRTPPAPHRLHSSSIQ